MAFRKIFLCLCTLFLGAHSSVSAADKVSTYSGPHLKASMVFDNRGTSSSGLAGIGVYFEIEPGWHIYYKVPGTVGLPTTITWNKVPGAEIGELVWPTPREFNYDGEKSFGYENEVLLASPLQFGRTDLINSTVVGARVEWVLCKDECLPGEATFVSSLGALSSLNTKLSALFDKSFSKEIPRSSTQSFAGEKSLLVALCFAFIGGMILNLMPCVLPVLSLKVLGLMSTQNARERTIHGILYSVGVLVSFWLLGGVFIGLKAIGSEVGWGFQFQSPQFVVGVLFLVFLIGLNLAGVFEIGMSVQNKAGSIQTSNGNTGAFLSGVLATALATPCTAPFMGSAIAATLGMSFIGAFLIFSALGLGLALPYFAVSASPRLARFLPKPGAWMEHFKQALSFPMFFTGAWLLWVIGNQRGVDSVATVAFGLVLIALGAWILGKWHLPSKSLRVRRWALGLASACFLSALGLSLPGGAVASAPTNTSPAVHQLAWESYSAAKLAELNKNKRPVLVDFTAAWCLVCQVNERRIFQNSEVAELIERKGVALLKADWTNSSPEIRDALTSFGQSGVPLVLLFDSNGKRSDFTGIIGLSEFIDSLSKV